MKSLFLITGFLFSCALAIGQAKDGTVELQRTVSAQPAASIYLPYSPDVVKQAFNDYLTKTTGKEAKGYLLSSNTLLVKNNADIADMYFLIDLKDNRNKNESVVFLKLNSSFKGENAAGVTPVTFNMQDAKDYLDNLAVAIKPYASELQLKLQQKNLLNAKDKSNELVVKGKRLERQRKQIQARIDKNAKSQMNRGLAQRKEKNDRLINENLFALETLNTDIAQQTAALTLLQN